MFAKLSCVQIKFVSRKNIAKGSTTYKCVSAMNKLSSSYCLAIIMLIGGHTVILNLLSNCGPLVIRLSSRCNDVVIRVVPK